MTLALHRLHRLGGWMAAAAFLSLVLSSAGLAQEEPDPGEFRIYSASTESRGGVFYLNARLGLRLSSEARQALASGLPLTIRMEVEFLNRLRLWWDLEEWTLQQRYQLEYHSLTELYLVTNVNSGERETYPSLNSALAAIGTIDGWPLIDEALLDEDRRYDVRLRAVLDTERLPGPLRLMAFWRRDWSLGSGWYEWRLDEE